jgi:uncharacterized CHY-type Zn-finger protein
MASHKYIRIIAYKVHFNLLHNVLLFLQVEMATSRDILGGICEAQHVTKNADQWCPECGEGLCSDCENHIYTFFCCDFFLLLIPFVMLLYEMVYQF